MIPIIVIVFGCFLVVAPIISDPRWEYLYVLVALFIGFLVYIPFVFYKYSFSFMGKALYTFYEEISNSIK